MHAIQRRTGLLVLVFSLSAGAQETDQAPLTQEPVVVTPGRIPEPAADSLASVSVITRDDIEASQARDLTDLLRLLPGVDVARAGGPGQQTSVFLRGTNSNHTLVLIDGVRASSVNTGSFTWENLPVSQIQRIEIVRGPRSGDYGSGAIGGVIQVFTRRITGGTLRVEAGSFRTRGAEAGAAAGNDALSFTAHVAVSDTGGFSAQNENGFLFVPDDDGYENRSLSLGLSAATGNRSDLHVRFFWSDGEVEFDEGVSDTVNATVGTRWTVHGEDESRHRLGVALTHDAVETAAFGSLFETDRIALDYFYDRPVFDDGLFSAGINYVDEEGRQFDAFTGTDIYNTSREFVGVFGALSWRGGMHELRLNARHDDYSDFGAETTGNVSWGLSPDRRLQLVFSLGTAFRAPNFNELFSPGFAGAFAGNPELDAERSASAEANLRLRISDRQRVTLNLFFTRVDDLIAFEGDNFQAVNIDEAEIAGLELAYALGLDPWRLRATGTLQSAENARTGAELLRRPRQKAALRLDRRFGDRGTLGAELFASGERPDVGGVVLGGYALLNLHARFPLGRAWTLEARAQNLLDRDYALAAGFNTPGRSAYLGLRWSPGASD